MRAVYLLLAVAGAIVPYVFFIGHFQESGLRLGGFVQALFANGAAGGFTADLLITSFVFWIWLFKSGARRPWIYILVNLTIGLSCAFPAYLYVRSGSGNNT
jgi:hypothetical protein